MARNKIDTMNKIITNTISIGAEGGIRAVTTQNIAKECKIVEGTIFLHFGTINNLLSTAFMSIDEQKAKAVTNLGEEIFEGNDNEKAARVIWDCYMNFWLTHPKETKYYMNFIHSPYYHYETHTVKDEAYISFIHNLLKLGSLSEAYQILGFMGTWDFIVNTTVGFAIKMSDGKIEENEKTKNYIFSLMFSKLLMK